jgi:hypothetical protein
MAPRNPRGVAGRPKVPRTVARGSHDGRPRYLHAFAQREALTLLRRGQSERMDREELDHYAGFRFCCGLALARKIGS